VVQGWLVLADGCCWLLMGGVGRLVRSRSSRVLCLMCPWFPASLASVPLASSLDGLLASRSPASLASGFSGSCSPCLLCASRSPVSGMCLLASGSCLSGCLVVLVLLPGWVLALLLPVFPGWLLSLSVGLVLLGYLSAACCAYWPMGYTWVGVYVLSFGRFWAWLGVTAFQVQKIPLAMSG
jgi:hypothetical protein